VWDLDPGPDVSRKQVVKAALLVRDVLTTLDLTSWVKTTGGRGLHVVVPLKPKRTVAECLDFSRAVSEAIASTDPDSYTTAFAKEGREQKILIDYLRNNRTNTSVCAFSPRARPGAVVSMPPGKAFKPFPALRSRRSHTYRRGDVGASRPGIRERLGSQTWLYMLERIRYPSRAGPCLPLTSLFPGD
jgi:hypothetical protein